MGLILSHLAPISKIRVHPLYNSIVGAAVTGGATPPSDSTFMKQNRFFRDLDSVGIMALLDCLYVDEHDGSESFGYYNWGNIGVARPTFTCIKTGTLTFTSKDGLKGDASTGSLNTQYSASGTFINYQVSGLSSMFCIVKETTADSGFLIGRTQSTDHIWLRPRLAADNTDCRPMTSTSHLTVASGITDGSGMWFMERDNSNGALYLRDMTTPIVSSSSLSAMNRPTGTVGRFARRAGASTIDNFSGLTQRICGWGGGMTSTQRQYLKLAYDLYHSSL